MPYTYQDKQRARRERIAAIDTLVRALRSNGLEAYVELAPQLWQTSFLGLPQRLGGRLWIISANGDMEAESEAK